MKGPERNRAPDVPEARFAPFARGWLGVYDPGKNQCPAKGVAMQAQDERSGQTGLSSCDQVHSCTCTMPMVSRRQPDRPPVCRISGPLLDRADLRRPAGRTLALISHRTGTIQARVEAARERFEGSSGLLSNAGALSRTASARPKCATTAGWTTRGHAAAQDEHPGLQRTLRSSRDPEAGPDHRRPGKQRRHRDGTPGRGHPVPPPKVNVSELAVWVRFTVPTTKNRPRTSTGRGGRPDWPAHNHHPKRNHDGSFVDAF
jgi:hypothetical protein